MRGCCFHFALAVHERYGYPLEFLPAETPADYVPDHPTLPSIGHCWALKAEHLAVDINGVMPVKLLIALFSPRCEFAPEPISPATLRECLAARKYLPSMDESALALAHHVLATHERMQDAKPIDETCADLFAPETAKRS